MKPKKPFKIFIVDDDLFCLNIYEQHLHNMGYANILLFDNGLSCLHNLTEEPDIIFLDYGMDELNGLDVLKKVKYSNPSIYVVFISAQDDIETAVDSIKYGAFDYIVKGQNDGKRIEQVLEKIDHIKEMLEK